MIGEYDFDARRFEMFDAPAGQARIGVGTADDHAHDAGADDGIDAGWRAAPVLAGFNGDIKRAAGSLEAGAFERLGLGMRTAAWSGDGAGNKGVGSAINDKGCGDRFIS